MNVFLANPSSDFEEKTRSTLNHWQVQTNLVVYHLLAATFLLHCDMDVAFRKGWLTSRIFSVASVLKSINWHTINVSKSTNIPTYISHRYFPHLPETDWKRVGHLAKYLTFEDLLALVCVIVYFDSWFEEISQTIDMLFAYKNFNEDHFVDYICSEEKNDAPSCWLSTSHLEQ